MPFKPDRDIPDLADKVILITGGNNGLWKESILQLAKHNPRQIFMGARSESKAQGAIVEIKRAVPGANISFLEIDLSEFSSIKKAADSFLQQSDRLDILMNNAGIFGVPPGLTKDGYEIQFGTNHMGPALLTRLLTPTLEKTASLPGSDVRIINLSSELFKYAPKSGLLLPHNKSSLSDISGTARYGQSKLANLYFAQSMARRYPSIKSVAIHPGVVQTSIFDNLKKSYPYFSWILQLFSKLFLTDVSTGALTQLWAATAISNVVNNGAFYYPVGKEFGGNSLSRNYELAEKLWEWTQTELKDHGF